MFMTPSPKGVKNMANGYFREAQSKEIDWEQRRYEIAKDVLIAFITKPEIIVTASYTKVAIGYADALIEELKKK